jgi:predicted RNA-binding Zn-ribbon protein involved in translation (DUF1610 family)
MEFIKICPVCGAEMLLQAPVDPETGKKKNQYVCSQCNTTEDYSHEK